MSALYPLAKQAFLSKQIDLVNDAVKAVLVATTYTYDAAHQYLSDLGANTVGAAQALTGKTVAGGVFDAADPSFTGLASTATVNAFAIYQDTGDPATSRLIVYDTLAATDLTNTTQINLTLDNGASKIFAL